MGHTVGMFGTCGKTTFRKDIMIPEFEKAGVDYFNPQVDHWTPECAEIEADHMANDDVILFPITKDTYGSASLAEVSFAILNSIKRGAKIVVMVDKDLDEKISEEDPIAAKESIRARKLVLAHLDKIKETNSNVVVANDIEEMTKQAIDLYNELEIESSPVKEKKTIDISNNEHVIGMFGTCGKTTFRKDTLIPEFEKAGVEYFNPQVDHWTSECAQIEADHMAKDDVILFPVTGETYGTGSLCELGFAAINAVQRGAKIITMVDDTVNKQLEEEDPVAAKESARARKLVKAHLNKSLNENISMVDNFEDMAEEAIEALNNSIEQNNLVDMSDINGEFLDHSTFDDNELVNDNVKEDEEVL